MYSRHYRYNPLFAATGGTISDVPDPLHTTFFDSITTARTFLAQTACLSQKQLSDSQMQAKIAAANKIVAKAERRNLRRRERRGGKAPTQAYKVRTCGESLNVSEKLCSPSNGPKKRQSLTASPETPSVLWEEVVGPKGELIRFKLKYHRDGPDVGKLKERKRVQKEAPKAGDIVLDLTSGIKAWKIGRTRESIPVTKEMEAIYKASNLYKVRQLAAGFISLQQLIEAVEKDSGMSTMRRRPSRLRVLPGDKLVNGRRAARRPEKPNKRRTTRKK